MIEPFKSGKVFPRCNDIVCQECWTAVLLERLNGRRSNKEAKIECPNKDCDSFLIDSNLEKLMENDGERNSFYRNQNQRFIKLFPLIQNCQNPKGCTNGILVEYFGEVSVRCECGFSFCFACLRAPHEPVTCAMLTKWLQNQPKCKPCPRCKSEVTGPTTSMKRQVVCKSKLCGFQFCWDCLMSWRTHPKHCTKSLLMTFHSNQSWPSQSFNNQSNSDDQDDASLQETRRSEHCYNGYKNNLAMLNIEEVLAPQIQVSFF